MSSAETTGLAERLAGRRVVLTGATGFVGQALLERLVVDLPDTPVSVLLRPKGRATAAARVAELADKPVFGRAQERLGGADAVRAHLAERVHAIDADLANGVPDLPDDTGVVLHTAATVAFDPGIDEAFSSNVTGATNVFDAASRCSSRPHVVHVSTAYVAGVTKGVVPEGPLDHNVDWSAELAAAQQWRAEAEAYSRRPEVLRRLQRRAASDHRRAGPQAVAQDTERRRRQLVTDRLVEAGRSRAQSLGWPDVYTFTKALGERAAEAHAGELPVSIVRPSIIESALAHPYPGWLEGFKMMDPIILAYGRGALPDFPGIPDGVIDLIPVDLVANGLLAIAAHPPSDGAASHYHISSGHRNPIIFDRLYRLVRDYYRDDPLPDPHHGDVRVPEWKFPGGAKLERLLRLAERAVDTSDRALGLLPRSDRVRGWMTTTHRRRRQVELLRRYSDLYGAYAEAEVLYTDDRAEALRCSLSPDDARDFGFDPTAIDWAQYLQEAHLPVISAWMRGPSQPAIASPLAEPDGNDRVLAVFDLEGTVLDSNVVRGYLAARLADLPRRRWAGELVDLVSSLPGYLAAERRDRGEFLRAFYKRYEGCDVDELRRLVDEELAETLLRQAAPEAVRRVRKHRAAGHRTVLVTGALEELVGPLAPLFDSVVAARLAVEDGRCTGHLSQPPLVGEGRAAWLRRYAQTEGFDLSKCWAYADSHSDLPLLEAVGNPVAVNPDAGLYRVARPRRWPVEKWGSRDDKSSSVLTGAR